MLAIVVVFVRLEAASGGEPKTQRVHLGAEGSASCLRTALLSAEDSGIQNRDGRGSAASTCRLSSVRYALGRDSAGATLEATFEGSGVTPVCALAIEARIREIFQVYLDCSGAHGQWAAECEKFVPGKGFIACHGIASER